MKRMTWLAALGALLVSGCGGGEETTTVEDVHHDTGGERPPPRDDGLQISGLLGTLSQDEIQRGVEPRMDRFESCFVQTVTSNEIVSGRVEFAFRVRLDGRVRWVYPRSSTVGDRATEQCLLGVASGVRFPQPHGGEAELSWSVEFPVGDDVRPPVRWEADRVAPLVGSQGGALLEQCGAGGTAVDVTAYVAPGGRVITAGASVPSAEALGHVDCLVEGVRGWAMPDPGSYPAKVTFSLR